MKQASPAFFVSAILSSLKKISLFFHRAYTPDLRALSLMRIGVAAVVITDLLIRMSDLGAHYTSEGIWPNHLVRTFGWNPGYWSLHLLNDNIGYQAAIFSLHLLAALCLLAGYRTRLATLLVWLLYVSLHNRNIFILQAGDDLLRLCLFWALFLPWGTRYSLDIILQNKPARVLLFPGLGYLLLIASVYFFTALLKSGDEWTKEGSAEQRSVHPRKSCA